MKEIDISAGTDITKAMVKLWDTFNAEGNHEPCTILFNGVRLMMFEDKEWEEL
jgi:hypothetical protein